MGHARQARTDRADLRRADGQARRSGRARQPRRLSRHEPGAGGAEPGRRALPPLQEDPGGTRSDRGAPERTRPRRRSVPHGDRGAAAAPGDARRARGEGEAGVGAQGPGREAQRGARDPRRDRRRRGDSVRRGALPHVQPLRRCARLGGRHPRPLRVRHSRRQGSVGDRRGPGRVRHPALRGGRPPGAAGAGDGGLRAHPHVGGHRRRAARGGGHRDRDRTLGLAGGHLLWRPAPAVRASTRPTRRCA